MIVKRNEENESMSCEALSKKREYREVTEGMPEKPT